MDDLWRSSSHSGAIVRQALIRRTSSQERAKNGGFEGIGTTTNGFTKVLPSFTMKTGGKWWFYRVLPWKLVKNDGFTMVLAWKLVVFHEFNDQRCRFKVELSIKNSGFTMSRLSWESSCWIGKGGFYLIFYPMYQRDESLRNWGKVSLRVSNRCSIREKEVLCFCGCINERIIFIHIHWSFSWWGNNITFFLLCFFHWIRFVMISEWSVNHPQLAQAQ